ncbi:uncharacterized protein LOC131671032 isoform X2 [Phymastichus coffea]|nr:uncharacterized protein LOC131671032 isoform X2 [Phymastichus coffea]
MRDARMLRVLDANGLAKTLQLRDELLKLLNQSSFHDNPQMIPELQHLKKLEVNRTEDLFKDLSLFKLNVEETSDCTIATICGVEEPDRYIVLSASYHGYDVAYKVAKSFDHLYRDHEKLWQPKRTIIFCVFIGKEDSCKDMILERIKPKIVAYIAIHGTAALGKDIAVSGSGMVQATMLDAVDEVRSFNGDELTVADSPIALQKLNIDVPHVVLSFIGENRSNQNSSENQKTLAQIAGITIFRLSEGIFFRWNPKYFGDIMNKTVKNMIVKPSIQGSVDNFTETINNLIRDIKKFNLILDKTNMLKLLDVRMMNDKLMDLDRAMLCHSSPKVDFEIFSQQSSINEHFIMNESNKIKKCYETANRIILDQAQCRQITKDQSDLSNHN